MTVRSPYDPRRLFDFLITLAMCMESRSPDPPSEEAAPEVQGLSLEVRGKISVALAHWRIVERKGDTNWDAAFTALSEALALASWMDVRLYMYTLSEDAAEFFRVYESEQVMP